jgi:hypothetical protein
VDLRRRRWFSFPIRGDQPYVAIVASLKFPALYASWDAGSRVPARHCYGGRVAFPSFFVYQWIGSSTRTGEVMVVATLILFLIADQRRSVAMTYAAVAMLGARRADPHDDPCSTFPSRWSCCIALESADRGSSPT